MSRSIIDHICSLCGSTLHKILYCGRDKALNKNDLNVGITSDIYGSFNDVIICSNCGFAQQNPLPDDNELYKAYKSLKDETYVEEDDCRSINAHLCLRTIRRFQSKGALLDVGCSTGMFLNAARLNFEVYGVEPSLWASDYAANALKLSNVINCSFESASVPKNYFNVISFIDVIEHMSNPKSAVEKAGELLKPGGLLYIVTPDIKSPSARLLGRYWWGLRESHVSYFSKETMSNLLSSLGFFVAEMKSYGRIFAYNYWLSRIRRYPSIFYNCAKYFGRIFKIEDKVIYLNTRDSIEVCAIKK